MPNNNKGLSAAGIAKNDEFYTQLSDIENELRHYKEHFRGKTVFCNCDDPYDSNFFRYFVLNFHQLGLRKLICTCYGGSSVIYTQLSLFGGGEEYGRDMKGKAYVIEVTKVEDFRKDGAVDLDDVHVLLKYVDGRPKLLKGDGDFRSKECIRYLKKSDIVVTNPPFSLFREYIGQLIEYEKKFIIIANQNAIHYKEVFPLIRQNKIWLGYGFAGNAGFFINKEYEDYATSSQHKEGMIRVSGVVWFTNLDIQKRNEELILFRKYNENDYPKYDNFDAIEVGKTNDIPCDYYGMMGVPDMFLDKYNPEQFEIIGLGCGDLAKEIGVTKNYRGRTDLAYTRDGKQKCPYSRIVIRRKNSVPENTEQGEDGDEE